ncbi:hypothetical protein GTU79_21345 [Sodalis ligni]|uniref:hypothetical protein n=1 Tax=Sodalis ligni TaxID=2697027 RepID=UPI00193FD769|nr:hypothetical protein [Sodalis ligni]QWA09828.1 hypothetical protein GTU79_21345 [Sodalis ligni]
MTISDFQIIKIDGGWRVQRGMSESLVARSYIENELLSDLLDAFSAARPSLGLHFSTPAELAAMLDHVSCFHELSAELIAEEMFKGAIAQSVNACTCPSGDGSLRWPCPIHPPTSAEKAIPTIQRIEPIEPQRDENGWWSHPDYIPDLEEDALRVEFEVWLEVNGVECSARLMEDDVEPDSPVAQAWENGDADCSIWNPKPPEGEGWFLVSVHDTEDGPSAVWLRKLPDAQPTTPYDALVRFYRKLHEEHRELEGKAQRLRYRCENLDGQLKELKAARLTPTAPAVPDGWKLVPITATRSMIQAGATAARQYMEETGGNSPYVIYQAMIAAAPSPTSTEGK